MSTRRSMNDLGRGVLRQAIVMLSVVAFLWLLELADMILWRGGLDMYGIRPRTWAGLGHIFVAPFLHGGFGHLFANTVPFLILGWFVLMRRTWDFFLVFFITALISGLGVWIFGGANTIHIGASGVIFGFLGYLLARGYFERSRAAIPLAILAGVLFGGMLWGMMPGQDGISWLGHLFGFLGGGLVAYLVADRRG